MQTSARTNTIEALTFYASDIPFAVDIGNVLTISEKLNAIRDVPLQARGLLGVANYQNTLVPVFNLAHRLKLPSSQEKRKELIEQLETYESAHIEWITALEHSLQTGERFTKPEDPTQCAFGRWYGAFETRDETLRDILAEFDEPHRRIHSLASSLLNQSRSGDKDGALEQLNAERETTLRRLLSLFRQAREQIQSIMRPVVLYVTFNGNTPSFGLVVDEIDDVMRFSEDDYQTTVNIGLNRLDPDSVLLKGMLVDRNGPDVLWLDVDQVLGEFDLDALEEVS